MADLNNINVTGHLTRDPDLRNTPSGKDVCNFRVAVNGFKDDEATFLDVTAWEGMGRSCAQYLSKGSHVAVSGRLGVREYTRGDGSDWLAVEVTARDVAFLDTKAESEALRGNGGGRAPAQASAPAASGGSDDDIPF